MPEVQAENKVSSALTHLHFAELYKQRNLLQTIHWSTLTACSSAAERDFSKGACALAQQQKPKRASISRNALSLSTSML